MAHSNSTTAGEAATTAAGADAKGSGAIASLATTFNTTATYNVGDVVIYKNLLYVCQGYDNYQLSAFDYYDLMVKTY